jgi:cellulose synthase/poly-beta-1,6-N-acetylglucosamine synthase-like glycosyltransferase
VAIVFFISVFLILHSYVLYPLILWFLAQNKKIKYQQYSPNQDLPFLSILVAAHNEESVIGQKIESIFNTNYPSNKFEVIIGSDCSTDNTIKIVKNKTSKYSNLYLEEFSSRQGKVSVMNKMLDLAKGEIIVSTDANVMLIPSTLFELAKFFKDSSVGLVDTRMENTGLRREGISIQESTYISFEVLAKYREGLLWGAMIGPFGGCYAIRKESYQKPPTNLLVDDFYINMKVLEKGKACISNIDAVVYEDVSNDLREEFRRKVRIAIGNFQNLKFFKLLLWPPNRPVAFAFLSHKVLRWLGPLLIIVAFASNVFLVNQNQLFPILLSVQLVLLGLPLIDFILRSINIHIQFLRFATHFFSMNIALLVGLIKYLKGVKSNVWQPTQRNQ